MLQKTNAISKNMISIKIDTSNSHFIELQK